MPEFTLDESDKCPHCGHPLRDPPNCCRDMMREYAEEMEDRLNNSNTNEKKEMNENG
jgi:predicted amidophosphoribosyltransferase